MTMEELEALLETNISEMKEGIVNLVKEGKYRSDIELLAAKLKAYEELLAFITKH